MISRRKLLSLLAAGLAAPKELFAAPKPKIPGEFMFIVPISPGTLYWSKRDTTYDYPATPDECLVASRPKTFMHFSEIGHWPDDIA